jgi:NADPH:quinone reductase-like Zn-dependent oxidoreductase
MDNGWISNYPWVPGADIAGTIIKLGSGVTKYSIGDRVISLQMSSASSLGNRGAALQDYAIVDEDLSTKIPQHYSSTQASTVPVTMLTSFAAIHTFGWSLPLQNEKLHSEPILVWGGGTGVGQASIALLKLAGFTNIITTASIKRKDYLKDRGAAHVVDYREKEIITDIKRVVENAPITKAIDTISTPESSQQVLSLLAPGAELAFVLPDSSLARRSDVRSEFVLCGMFHDVSSFLDQSRFLLNKLLTHFVVLECSPKSCFKEVWIRYHLAFDRTSLERKPVFLPALVFSSC